MELNRSPNSAENSVLLYVEDDPSTARLFKIAAHDVNCTQSVFLAKDGDSALAFLNHSNGHGDVPFPNIVVLDLDLPSRNGFEILESMQKAERTADIPVIFFTSSDLKSDRDKALKMGALAFVHKPNDLDGFLSAVRYICSLAASQRTSGI